MVGSGADGGGGGDDARSKEAAGMMALHEALRNVCLDSDWTYSVFWTIRPRPRCRGGNGCMVGDDNGSLMLMWEDGFCRPRVAECLADMSGGEDPVRKAFIKMSIQLYNYGEGLMGKVASDKCHKWVFKEPSECEPNISNYWQSSFDALPPEWTDQFASGIQTIAVIQAGHGLLQLGSCKIIPEDLHFVLRMRHTFESLGYQSGFFLSQLFSSARGASPTPPPPAARPPPAQLFNWPGAHQPQLFSPGPVAFHHPSARAMPPLFPGGGKDEGHMFHFHIPPAHHGSKPLHMDEHQHHQHQQTMGAGGEAPDGELRWPNVRAVLLHRAHRARGRREAAIRWSRRRGRREGGAGRADRARRGRERGGVPEPGEPLGQGEQGGERRPEHQVQEELHVARAGELVHDHVPVCVGFHGAARDGVPRDARGRRLLGPHGDVLGLASLIRSMHA